MSMLVEHSLPGTARMQPVPEGCFVRIWIEEGKRFVTIQPVNNGTAVLISHYLAPGGHSYAAELVMAPDTSHSIILK